MKSQLLIAAAHSGAGKTTVTLGVLRALQRRGYRVQPFKCGPDFIDPLHHYAAAGKASINLDRFMMSDAHLKQLYHRYGSEADVCVTEGVMGLFDGASRMEGSSADIARLLQLPVVLVLNAKAMAYTAAAILYGLKHFCRDITIAGVIFNFVDSSSHYQFLKEAAEDVGVKALGHLPTEKALRIPSRYLGLDTSAETDRDAVISAAADHMEKYLDLEALLECTRMEGGTTVGSERVTVDDRKWQAGGSAEPGGRMILVARDAAFNFIYPENIRCLERFGTVRYFSPMRDTLLPPADLIYLPGGYPEWHLEALAANEGLLRQIRDYYARGGKILAECGGMMYLGRSIADEQGKPYPMTGILDLATGVEQKKLSLGYRVLQTGGRVIRGHEFHYSQFTSPLPERASTATVLNARQEPTDTPLFHNGQLFASYMHLYWAEQPELLKEWFSWQ